MRNKLNRHFGAFGIEAFRFEQISDGSGELLQQLFQGRSLDVKAMQVVAAFDKPNIRLGIKGCLYDNELAFHAISTALPAPDPDHNVVRKTHN
jgi:hypothetical protein